MYPSIANGEAFAAPEHPGIPLLQDELRSQSIHPPGNERAIGAFCEAVLARTDDDGDMRPILSEMLHARAPLGSDTNNPDFGNIVTDLRSIILTHRDSYHPNFDPSNYVAKNDWSSILDDFVNTLIHRNDMGGISPEHIVKMLHDYRSEDVFQLHYSIVDLYMLMTQKRRLQKLDIAEFSEDYGPGSHISNAKLKSMPFNRLVQDDSTIGDISAQANTILGSKQIDRNLSYFGNKGLLNSDGTISDFWLRPFYGSRTRRERNDPELIAFYRRTMSAAYKGISEHSFSRSLGHCALNVKRKGSFDYILLDDNNHDDYEKMALLLKPAGALLIKKNETRGGQKVYKLKTFNPNRNANLVQFAESSNPFAMDVTLSPAQLKIGGRLWTPEERILHLAEQV